MRSVSCGPGVGFVVITRGFEIERKKAASDYSPWTMSGPVDYHTVVGTFGEIYKVLLCLSRTRERQ